MTVGSIFLILALIIFFTVGVGMQLMPRAEIWGWVCITLALLLGGWPLPPWPRT